MTVVSIRPLNTGTEYERAAELLSVARGHTVSASDEKEWDAIDREGQIVERYVATPPSNPNLVIGFAALDHYQWMPEGRFDVFLTVDPQNRQQGIGSQLYDWIESRAASHHATAFECKVRTNSDASLHFMQARGYEIKRKTTESRIDLKTFDTSQLDSLVKSVEADGIQFTSLAAEGDTEAARRKLHHVNAVCDSDDPADHDGFPSFEDFNANFNNVSWFLPQGQLLALDGDDYVGLCAVGYYEDTNSMYNLFTGVMPDYRGRKIAQALKVLSIRFAQDYGADYIRTENDSKNQSILAINRKLGYEPHSGDYMMVKQL